MRKKRVWISWERQRRTIVLSEQFNCLLYVYISPVKIPFVRYPLSIFYTLIFLLKNRPNIVFCQNPSIVLTILLCLIKYIMRYNLIVDRHSNFMLSRDPGFIKSLFLLLSRITIKLSDMTIVTNRYLLNNYVLSQGSKGYVLQDKIPILGNKYKMKFSSEKNNILFITSFGKDEPISEYLESMMHLKGDYHTYITGNYKKYKQNLFDNERITFTGFIDDDFFITLLNAVDIVVVLTKHDHTLTCGAYEAIAAGKPMVLSNTDAIKNYFTAGAVYTDNTPTSIASAISECAENRLELSLDVATLRSELDKMWSQDFNTLRELLLVDNY